MKGGNILLAVLVLSMIAAGCSKPAEGTTYVPPPVVHPVKNGTLYLANSGYFGMDYYIGNDFFKFIDGKTYMKKDVPPGLYNIRAIQAEGVRPGAQPFSTGLSVTVTADHTTVVSLP